MCEPTFEDESRSERNEVNLERKLKVINGHSSPLEQLIRIRSTAAKNVPNVKWHVKSMHSHCFC